MKENSIEEDIAITKKLITTKFNNDYSIDNKDKEAIEHILTDYKRVLKENETLKCSIAVANKLEERIKEKFIPKEKIVDIIEKIIELYDLWLFNLPQGVSDRISIAEVANELNIEFSMAKGILEDSVSLGILERRYAIKCPECNHVIEIVSIEELYDKIKSINNCDACETEDLTITDEDIQVLYKKIENEIKIHR